MLLVLKLCSFSTALVQKSVSSAAVGHLARTRHSDVDFIVSSVQQQVPKSRPINKRHHKRARQRQELARKRRNMQLRTKHHTFVPSSQKGQNSRLRKCMVQYINKLNSIRPSLGDHLRDISYTPRITSHRGIVISVGSGTTGTRALANALRMLGLNIQHWYDQGDNLEFISAVEEALKLPERQCFAKLNEANYVQLLKKVGALLDTPASEMFLDLWLVFPKAKFILTTRKSDDWAAKRLKEHPDSYLPVERPCSLPRFNNKMVSNVTSNFGDFSLIDKQDMFDAHNELVRCTVPKDRLFEFDVFSNPPDNLMSKLSQFLDLPPPTYNNGTERPYPAQLLQKH
eukprot:TRINITY_DN8761_c0_g2_i1.p1 TRINITY_DN8761_c0_g2~~TRINITY_DN8761_c0_g2_i1.p1  ORF type:complete len:376 (+),score=30.16 TRINITY_DN8761_c0_g2_i1:103-1128(+)